MAGPQFRLRLFGEVSAEFDGRPVRVAARPLCAVLLAMLATRPGERLARKVLAAEIWPDESDTAKASGNLRRHLSALQSELPPPPVAGVWIDADGTTLAWSQAQPFWCDALAFDASLRDPNADPAAFAAAADFMRGYTTDWVLAERENYRALAIERLLAMCVERQDDDRLDDALACANAVLRIDPLCEPAALLAIDLCGERGDPIGAGQIYAAFAERLQRELDARPAAATVAAIERVRSAATSSRARVPRALTTFVGRSLAVADLEIALDRHRCVTILGPGGAGKTRLSLETARSVAHRFVDGTYFIDLSSVAATDSILGTVVRALELPRELASTGLEGVKRFLRNRRALVVLDNCEQVRDACAALACDVLENGPRVTILATSRVALGIRAESLFRLVPLTPGEARALFVERTRDAGIASIESEADFERIDRICAALDRSPLAVELAAGLGGSMGLADIERQLTDRFAMLRSNDPSAPARHRTLEATIAWSFDLLDSAERRLFERLAVFPASFTFDAAVAIGGEATSTLLGLIEKSMVQRDETDSDRYRLLFSLAEFAQRRIARVPDADAVRLRHARHYAELAFYAETPTFFRGEMRWMRDIERELQNVRAALRTLLAGDADDVRLGIRSVLALERFFNTRGYFAEGIAWLELARSRAAAHSHEYALIRWRTGKLLMKRRAFDDAFAAVSEAAAYFQATTARADSARALTELGAISISRADLAGARRYFDEALPLAEAENLSGTKAVVLGNLGVLETAAGNHNASARYYTEAARLFRREGDRRLVGRMIDNLAGLEFIAGRYAAATALLTEALQIARDLGDAPLVADVLCDCGDVLLADHRVDDAAERFEEALATAVPLGLPYATSQALMGFAGVAAALGDGRRAARLAGASAAGVEGGIATQVNGALSNRTRHAAVESIGEAEFERERRLGELLDFREVLDLAAQIGNSPRRPRHARADL